MALGEGRMIGSDALRRSLYGEIVRGTMSHAYLLEGVRGFGKHLLATLLCAAISCGRRGEGGALPCGKCPSCEKILAGKSPDVRIIGKQPDRTTIGIDDVRFLHADVLIPPNDLAQKFYIIEDAQDMTGAAQNALLLTLEEPPPYVVFFLLCENTANILETVISRAPTLRIAPVDVSQMRDYLEKTEPSFRALSHPDGQELLQMSGGSVGRALSLLDAKARKPLTGRRKTAEKTVRCCLERGDAMQRMECFREFGNVREEVTEKLTLMIQALRDLLLLKRSDSRTLLFYADREEAMQLSAGVSTKQLLHWLEAVEGARRRVLQNANIRMTLTTLLLCGSGEQIS